MTSEPPPPPPQMSYSASPRPAAPAGKGGAGKWIACGCSGCLGLVLLVAAGIYFFVSKISDSIRSSEPYKLSLERARASEELKAITGESLEPVISWFTPGSVSVVNGNETITFAIPMKGSKGVVVAIVCNASRSGDGPWTYQMMQAQPEGKAPIDLGVGLPGIETAPADPAVPADQPAEPAVPQEPR